MTSIQKLWAGVVVAIVIAVIGVFTPLARHGFGTILDTFTGDYFNATTGFQLAGTSFYTSSGLKVNSTSTTVGRLNTGFCYVQAYATTIAASSTANVDCQGSASVNGTNTASDTPLTGVTNGDSVVATLSTTTVGTTVGGLQLIAASASSTSGYIVLRVFNATGGTFTWPISGAATGTASYVVTH